MDYTMTMFCELDDIPFVCKDFWSRAMERESLTHEWVELVGGPLDGRRLKEKDVKFHHNSSTEYLINGNIYKPLRVTKIGGKNVLKLEYKGKYAGKRRKDS